MEKDFETFMSQLQETNQTLDFFCDFDKITNNVDNIKISLCILNSLMENVLFLIDSLKAWMVLLNI